MDDISQLTHTPAKNECRGSMRRLAVALSVGVSILGLSLCHVPERLSAAVIVECLCAVGYSHLHFTTATSFCVDGYGYHVGWTCTPCVLLLCGIPLLWFRQQSALRYFVVCTVFCTCASLLIFIGVACSIVIHQCGVSWKWIHYPQLAVIYSGGLR